MVCRRKGAKESAGEMPSLIMPRITISYRRDDSGVITGRIFDRLTAHYGRESVFRDIDNIPPGIDFRKHITETLDASDIVLAIIGPKWVGPRANQSRLANIADPVRVEIETALRKDKPVIPVLVLRANMPRPEQLPDTLQDFAYRHAVTVDAGQDFDVHMRRLTRAMDRIFNAETEGPATAPELAEPEIGGIIADETPLPQATDAREHNPQQTAETDALRETNRALEEQIAALTYARDERTQQAEHLGNEIVGLRETNRVLEKRAQQVEGLREEVTGFRENKRALEEQVAALTRARDERAKQAENLSQEIKLLRETNLAQAGQVAALTRARDECARQAGSLNHEIVGIRQSKEEELRTLTQQLAKTHDLSSSRAKSAEETNNKYVEGERRIRMLTAKLENKKDIPVTLRPYRVAVLMMLLLLIGIAGFSVRQLTFRSERLVQNITESGGLGLVFDADAIIRGIQPNSAAARAGFQLGDRVLQVNYNAVRNADEFYSKLSFYISIMKAKDKNEIPILIQREGEHGKELVDITLKL
jgi:TIR domain-containing protein/PDZ domain-containing protein